MGSRADGAGHAGSGGVSGLGFCGVCVCGCVGGWEHLDGASARRQQRLEAGCEREYVHLRPEIRSSVEHAARREAGQEGGVRGSVRGVVARGIGARSRGEE